MIAIFRSPKHRSRWGLHGLVTSVDVWQDVSSELSSGIYCRVKWLSTDVSEVRTASIIRDDHDWWWWWLIPDDGGSMHLWNVGRQSFYTAVYPRRQLWTSYSLPWELEISQDVSVCCEVTCSEMSIQTIKIRQCFLFLKGCQHVVLLF
jgi:hypothetical protein